MYSVVIPSRSIGNLTACCEAVQRREPNLPARNIIVVDDDETGEVEGLCERLRMTHIKGLKPFIFARNANLGLQIAFQIAPYAILLNDDAILSTRRGFTFLAHEAHTQPSYGLIAAATNVVGNANQMPQGAFLIRREHRMLCFVCVLITRTVWQRVGPLDEDYSLDYGAEDGDYSYRVKQSGLKLGVYDRCFVDHGRLRSTFRKDGPRSSEQNRGIFETKWGLPYADI